MRCYICNKKISSVQLKAYKALYIGGDLYRHIKCGTKLIDEKNYQKIRKKLGRK